MFRKCILTKAILTSFPRVCGDVPIIWVDFVAHAWFSPRVRGCSSARAGLMYRTAVFPACAGMFLFPPEKRVENQRFPRVCGDVPHCINLAGVISVFSPRVRGCSFPLVNPPFYRMVFPACAGMFRPFCPFSASAASFPRVCGDVPRFVYDFLPELMFSPRVRGCSSHPNSRAWRQSVFPACAGMFRTHAAAPGRRHRFPRVCGDVPQLQPMNQVGVPFSPRVRGCSFPAAPPGGRSRVFPACAGMFRYLADRTCYRLRFPRVCGDVP